MFQRNGELLVTEIISERIKESVGVFVQAGLVPAEQGQQLLEVEGYLGWLMEQTASWRRGLCGRRVMQGCLGHDCVPTLAQRVCGSGDTDQRCPTERVIRSRSGPAQRGIWRVVNENGRG